MNTWLLSTRDYCQHIYPSYRVVIYVTGSIRQLHYLELFVVNNNTFTLDNLSGILPEISVFKIMKDSEAVYVSKLQETLEDISSFIS